MQRNSLALVLDINEAGVVRDKKLDDIIMDVDKFTECGIFVNIGKEPFDIPELNIKVAINVKKIEDDIEVACEDIYEYIRSIINSVNIVDEAKVIYRGVTSALKEAQETLQVHPFDSQWVILDVSSKLHQVYVDRCKEIMKERNE